jgi:hypothetical protein
VSVPRERFDSRRDDVIGAHQQYRVIAAHRRDQLMACLPESIVALELLKRPTIKPIGARSRRRRR